MTFTSSRSWFSNLTLPDPMMQGMPTDIQIDENPACVLSRSCSPDAFSQAVTDRLERALAWDRTVSEKQRTRFSDLLQTMEVSFEYLDVYVVAFRRPAPRSPGSHVEAFEVIVTPSGEILGSRITSELIVESW